MCSTPPGVDRLPIGGSGRLVEWQMKKTLSLLIPALSREGLWRPTVMTQRDSMRVSWSNRPSAPPFMSPKSSDTAKASASFSAMRRVVGSGSPVAASVVSVAVVFTA